jgi:hypothetical protein
MDVKTGGSKRMVFLGKRGMPDPQTVEYGHRLGTYDDMQRVAFMLQNRINDLRDTDPKVFARVGSDMRELDFAWHGIHGWEC